MALFRIDDFDPSDLPRTDVGGGMKLTPYNHGMDGYNIEIEVDGAVLKFWERAETVHALIRRGMEAQRERDAKTCDSFMMPSMARTIRKDAIDDAAIQSALAGAGE